MKTIVYIKAPQCAELQHTHIILKDFLTVYSKNEPLKQHILSLPFYDFNKEKKEQLVISILKIIEIITETFPEIEIQNTGEEDIIINYTPPQKYAKLKESIYTIFICLVAFFGGGYAIMAYNTDAGAKELFTYLSTLFLGNPTAGVNCLIITYSIGLAFGMILFFNHIGGKKLNTDPTPLEIQMRLYEKDLATTIIKDISRRGENIDVNQ